MHMQIPILGAIVCLDPSGPSYRGYNQRQSEGNFGYIKRCRDVDYAGLSQRQANPGVSVQWQNGNMNIYTMRDLIILPRFYLQAPFRGSEMIHQGEDLDADLYTEERALSRLVDIKDTILYRARNEGMPDPNDAIDWIDEVMHNSVMIPYRTFMNHPLIREDHSLQEIRDHVEVTLKLEAAYQRELDVRKRENEETREQAEVNPLLGTLSDAIPRPVSANLSRLNLARAVLDDNYRQAGESMDDWLQRMVDEGAEVTSEMMMHATSMDE